MAKINNRANKITSLHYFFAFIIFSIYGGRVCPFLDSLSLLQLIIPLFIGFSIALLCRLKLQKSIDKLSIEKQIKAQFFLEQKIFIITGFSLALFNTIYFEFPLESALKVLFGTIILGIFIGIDQALIRERTTIKESIKQKVNLKVSSYLSIPSKFIYMSILMLGTITGVLMLVITKDLGWFYSQTFIEGFDFDTAKNSILKEVTFIILTVLAYSIRIILMFGSNLKILLNTQNNVLSTIANGNLQTKVPVVTNDEFGLMAQGTNHMILDLKNKQEEVKRTRDVIILGMASLAEARDNETGAHIIRTQEYVKVLALVLQKNEKYKDFLTDENIDILYKSAPLHDIGKVGIPDNILLKPGKLTFEEFNVMKKHSQIGAEAIRSTKGELIDDTFLNFAEEIANYHHEKYDGSGYPNGLVGEEIPLSARLMAVADVYDALISKRVYKEGFTHEKAKEIIVEGKGTHFDPDVVDAFIQVEEKFVEIKKEAE